MDGFEDHYSAVELSRYVVAGDGIEPSTFRL